MKLKLKEILGSFIIGYYALTPSISYGKSFTCEEVIQIESDLWRDYQNLFHISMSYYNEDDLENYKESLLERIKVLDDLLFVNNEILFRKCLDKNSSDIFDISSVKSDTISHYLETFEK